MILNLGCTLIRNHEYALFKEFFISILPFYEVNVVELIYECFKHFNMECLVPIFALCGKDNLICKSRLASSVLVAKKDQD